MKISAGMTVASRGRLAEIGGSVPAASDYECYWSELYPCRYPR